MKFKVGRRRYDIGFIYKKYVRGLLSAKTAKLLFLGPIPFKKKNRIVLISHTFSGNAKAFAQWLSDNQNEYEVAFATDEPNYYKKAMREFLHNYPGIKFMSLQKLSHLSYISRAKVVVMTHGSLTLLEWKDVDINKLPIFVETWHGVGFKGRLSDVVGVSKFYSAIFVSSPYFKKLHEGWGFPPNKVKVTGYARSDRLFGQVKNKKQVAETYGLKDLDERRLALFAPTWRLDPNSEQTMLGEPIEKLLTKLNSFAAKQNLVIVFRPHLNSELTGRVQSLKNLKVVASADYPDTEGLLSITDVVVTDWSSIYTDFLVTNRPTIFIDTKPDFDGKALQPDDRAGAIVGSYKELQQALENALNNTSDYIAEYRENQERVKEKAWGNNADGKSSERYFKEIKKLIKDKYDQ